jgi:hypothetical protein
MLMLIALLILSRGNQRLPFSKFRVLPLLPDEPVPPRDQHTRHPTLSSLYVDLIQTLSPDAVQSADSNPFEYLLPYCRILGLDYAHEISDFRESMEFDILADDHDIWRNCNERFVACRHHFRTSFNALHRISQHQSDLEDWEHLSIMVDQVGSELSDFQNRRVGELSLRESKESIKQTESVRRLSQLAFVFIPLTFISSVFGMNLTVFGQGTGKAWVFTVAAISTTAGVILLSAFYPIIIKAFKHFRSAGVQFSRPLQSVVILAKYQPRQALWVLWFGIRYPNKLRSYVANIGLFSELFPGEFGSIRFYNPEKRLQLTPFWHKKGEEVFIFFQDPGWRWNTAWNRLRKRGIEEIEEA